MTRLVSQGHAARNGAGIKLRQPLAEAAFAVGTADERQIVEKYADLIAEELNVKVIRLLDTASEVVDYRLHPLPRQLGQKYGSDFPGLRKAILELDPQPAADRLLAGESLRVAWDGEQVEILPGEVEVRLEPRPGFAAIGEAGYVAALDTELTDDLLLEGKAREVVRRVQEMRKRAGFDVDDHIRLEFEAEGIVAQAIEAHKEYLARETLADEVEGTGDPSGDATETYQLDGDKLVMAVSRHTR